MAQDGLIRRLEQRRTQLMDTQQLQLDQWRDISEFILPHRGRFRGQRPNERPRQSDRVMDSAAQYALRTLAAGMQSGVTSPSRQWFRIKTSDAELEEDYEVRQWCDEVHDRMMAIMAGSNFYQCTPQLYSEIAAFGTAVMVIQADFDSVIRCRVMTAGRYLLGIGATGRVDTMYRDLYLTAAQLAEEFGEESLPDPVRNALNGDTPRRDQIFEVRHAVEPDMSATSGHRHKWRSVYWLVGDERQIPLRVGGYKTFPVMAPRWDVVDDDVWGHGPGHDALPDVKALQVMKKDLLQSVDKQVNPPMLGSSNLMGTTMRTTPGGITFVDVGAGGLKDVLQPLYAPNMPLDGLQMIINDAKQTVDRAFFADLFLMLQGDDGPKMTAREVVERHEEKLIVLGPVLERLEGEFLNPCINRIFDIMLEAGMIPEPPEALQGQDLKIDYVSTLAQAQRMMGLKPMDDFLSFVGQIGQMAPQALDVIDPDAIVREYATVLGVPVKVLVDEEAVAQVREQRQAQEQQAAQMEQMQQVAGAGAQGAQAAKALSEVNMQPDTALSALMGGVAGGGAFDGMSGAGGG